LATDCSGEGSTSDIFELECQQSFSLGVLSWQTAGFCNNGVQLSFSSQVKLRSNATIHSFLKGLFLIFNTIHLIVNLINGALWSTEDLNILIVLVVEFLIWILMVPGKIFL